MTSTSSTSPNLATREALEVEYLKRLAAADMAHWRAVMVARDSIESRGSVKRINSTYKASRSAHADISVSPFEEPYSVGGILT